MAPDDMNSYPIIIFYVIAIVLGLVAIPLGRMITKEIDEADQRIAALTKHT